MTLYKATIFTRDRGVLKILANKKKKKKVMLGIIGRKNEHCLYFKGEFHYLVTQGMYFSADTAGLLLILKDGVTI